MHAGREELIDMDGFSTTLYVGPMKNLALYPSQSTPARISHLPDDSQAYPEP